VIDLKYSLVIEATEDPTFFGFYSPDLEGFTGVGHPIEDCLYKPSGVWRSILNCSRNSPFLFPQKTPILKSLYRTKSL
jgi:predicted RNase H-like HicB family nuclease